MSGLNRASWRSKLGVGEGQEAPTQISEKREGEERGQFDLALVYGWIWNLRIPIMFIKYRDQP